MHPAGKWILEQWPEESAEQRLVRSVLNGDDAAFDALVRQHSAQVTSAVRRVSNEPNEVEDIVQEAFLRAYQHLRRFRGRSQLRTWLIQIAVNVCRDRQRSFWKRRVRFSLPEGPDPDRPAEVRERLLQPFRARVTLQGVLTLDELADLAACLSDTQARGMYRYWGWYLEGTGILPTDYFFGHRQHLRFWASRSPLQRGLLREGGALSVADLLPGQRQLWADALTSPPENDRTPSTGQRIPTADEVALGSFKLRVTENQAALFVSPNKDGKRQSATSIIVEGPANYDIRKLVQSDPGNLPLESAGPPLALVGYVFQYYVGGAPEPLRTTRILIAPPPQPAPGRSDAGAGKKELPQ